MKAWLLLCLCLPVGVLQAQTLTPDSFAYGMELQLDGQRAVYELALPAAVYRATRHQDLADVRVFNRAGEVVPHALLTLVPDSPVAAESTLDLPWYPVPDISNATRHGSQLRIELGDAGQIVTIDGPEGLVTEKTAYIIDASQIKQPLLRLEFEVAEPADFVQRLTLDSGDDLARWQPLITSATLARLQHNGEQLERLTLELPRQQKKYLRVRWHGDTALELQRIRGVISADSGMAPANADTEISVRAQPDPDHDATLLYDSGGYFPVQRLNLQFADTNSMAHAQVQSRSDHDSDWRVRSRARFYRLQVDDATLSNEDYPIHPVTDRYWRVQFNDAGVVSRDPDRLPALKLGWKPHELRFLVRGEPPFVLAYGRGAEDVRQQRPRLASSDLPFDESLTGSATADAEYTLGGEIQLQTPATKVDWKQISLWSVLLLAVAGLGWMAVRLYRDMNSGKH
ncbi:MAG: DUF3999 domain-containing protein [Gammaproteobacteria bacterium]